MKKIIFLSFFMFICTAAYSDYENVALVEDSDGSINSSIAIGNTYLSKASCAFFKKYPQNFDVLFFFTTYKTTMFGTPEGWAVRRNIKGIGFDMPTDQSSKYCSANGRLRHAIKLADIANWPDDPEGIYNNAINGAYNGMEVIGHEFGHLYLVGAKYKDENGEHCTLRALNPGAEPSGGNCDGYNESDFHIHYSYYFDSRSVMFGSFIEDLGGGNFKFYNELRGFSELDQYFMGLRDKSEVGEMLLVNTQDISESSTTPLKKGETKTIKGTAIKINIGQIVAALGERIPSSEPCHYKAAFAIIYPKGQIPNSSILSKVDNYRKKFEEYFVWATSNRGSIDTTLDGSGKGTQNCPAPDVDAGYSDVVTQDIVAKDVIADASYDTLIDIFPDGDSQDINTDVFVNEDKGVIDTIGQDVLSDSGTATDSLETEDIVNIEDDINVVADRNIKDSKTEDADDSGGCSCNLVM